MKTVRSVLWIVAFALFSPALAAGEIAVAPEAASPKDDGQWTMPQKDFANTRYSELAEINTKNVPQLKVAFTVPSGTMIGQESAPLVIGDTLYFVTPYPNVLFAVDLKNGGKVKWTFDPNANASAQGVTCCEAVNRGPTYSDGVLFYNTVDDQTVAVDAKTGKLKWRVKHGDFTKGEALTGAPFVAKGKVFVGNSDADFGDRGWVVALDEKTGKQVWKAFATGPDKDVKIDPKYFKPFYPQYKGKDLGVKEWPADAWKIGGGTMWGFFGYDPEQNLLFHGTANPAPWNEKVRPGDNYWTNGIFARDADTGDAHWYYQFTPHDLWDHDGINESIILNLPWKGKTRKTVVRPERNGYVYVIDRTNGEVLAADEYVYVNSAKGVDMKTGRLIPNDQKSPKWGKVVRNICPNAPGAKDWNPSAFSKSTGLVYIPHNNLCMDWELTGVSYIAGTPYVGTNQSYYAGPGGNAGAFTAWDPIARKAVWEIKEKWPLWSGAAATAGGLVFYGDLEGYFKAVDAKTGDILWKFKTSSGIIGQPTVFKGPDGHQYVAILSGIGGWVGATISHDLDTGDKTAAIGFGNLTGELKKVSARGGTLYVFSLPH